MTALARPESTFQLRHRRARRSAADWVLLIGIVIVAFLIAVPFLIILINSFKSPSDYASSGPLTLPKALYFGGLEKFWNYVNFPLKLWNSFFISAVVAVLAVIVSVLNAFAIGIGRVKGRTWILVLFLLANTIPQEGLLYPLYYMFKQVNLYDTQWAVIIIFMVI